MKKSALFLNKFIAIAALLLMAGSFSFPTLAQQREVAVAEFSKSKLSEWQEYSIKGKTEYRLKEEFGAKVLFASSRASASVLEKTVKIDLWQTPYVNWRWRIENRMPVRNETQIEGEDFPVRLIFHVRINNSSKQVQKIHYVWTRGVSKDSAWQSATNPDDIMIAVDDMQSPEGKWVNQKRHLLKDIQQYLGPEVRYIDKVSIMTDTDHTHSFVNSVYGDIFFSN